MFCSRCGSILRNDSKACPGCGQAVLSQAEQAIAARTAVYVTTIRKLGLWFLLFAALNAGLGIAGIVTGMATHPHVFKPFEPWPHPLLLEWTYLGASAWILLTLRVLLALVAGAALRVHAPVGRRLASAGAAIAVTQFPIGLLFGTYALVRLVGRANETMYAAAIGCRKSRRAEAREVKIG